MKRKFFFFDIDGTLAVGTPGNQYVPESTKIAISKLKEADVYKRQVLFDIHVQSQCNVRYLN